MIFMEVRLEDAVEAGILRQEEAEWLDSLRIPYPGDAATWKERRRLESLIKDAKETGRVPVVEKEPFVRQPSFYVISDYIGEGVQGMYSHADGKQYDSKSEYYKAVKAAGCVVLGNDAPSQAAPLDPKICEKDLKQDIKTAIEQLGG